MFASTVHQGEIDTRMGAIADVPEPPEPPRAIEEAPPAEPHQAIMGGLPPQPVVAPPEKTTKTKTTVKPPKTRQLMGIPTVRD